MKKVFFNIVLFLFISVCFQASAETVFEEELRTAGEDDTIVFRNYSGPHKKIDTVDQILGIGRSLGAGVGQEAGDFNYFAKYRIIHAVDNTVTDALDADILILSQEAAVDHIVNLRRIISGYLESAYDYDRAQADMLSIFITVYNAVHRNDIGYFTEKYKAVVYRNLSKEKAGLALSYDLWPGNTMIVIPLTPKAGSGALGDLDSDVLTEEGVIEKLREEDGQGIEPRREIVELKEDEILEERQEIKKEREELEQRQQELIEKKEELEKEADGTGKPEAVEAVEAELEQVAEGQTVLDEREKQVEKREESILLERESIAEDQKDEISRETPADRADKASETATEAPQPVRAAKVITVPFLKLSSGSGGYTGQLLLIDLDSGKILKRSEIDSIRLRGYRYTSDGILSVAGDSGGNRIVSIVKIDPESLEILQSGTVEVFIDSAVIESGGSYYAVVQSDGGWRIGIFNKNLELKQVSAAEVFPATEIYLRGEDVVVQDKNGTVRGLRKDDFITVP
ncbi:MAG: hypothetical protein JEZ04_01405 [Spirochaetales bacterium]|nr:hypothetical protein [Spirochaetales bacterium]